MALRGAIYTEIQPMHVRGSLSTDVELDLLAETNRNGLTLSQTLRERRVKELLAQYYVGFTPVEPNKEHVIIVDAANREMSGWITLQGSESSAELEEPNSSDAWIIMDWVLRWRVGQIYYQGVAVC